MRLRNRTSLLEKLFYFCPKNISTIDGGVPRICRSIFDDQIDKRNVRVWAMCMARQPVLNSVFFMS